MTIPVVVATTEIPRSELAGRTDVLVLGSSLGSTHRTWDFALAELEEAHTIVRWDLPGHGSSPAATSPFTLAELAQAVLNVLDDLGIDRFKYAGVSVSGALSLELAVLAPRRVTHIVPVCTSAKIGEPGPWSERADLVRAQGPGVLIAAQQERWFSPEFIEEEADTVADVMNQIAAADRGSYAYLCEAIGNFDARPRLGEIAAQTLVISGELDPATPVEAGEYMAAHIPGAHLEVIPGAYHQAIVEHPLVIARVINAFFAEN